jgi:hypothetical protein
VLAAKTGMFLAAVAIGGLGVRRIGRHRVHNRSVA